MDYFVDFIKAIGAILPIVLLTQCTSAELTISINNSTSVVPQVVQWYSKKELERH